MVRLLDLFAYGDAAVALRGEYVVEVAGLCAAVAVPCGENCGGRCLDSA